MSLNKPKSSVTSTSNNEPPPPSPSPTSISTNGNDVIDAVKAADKKKLSKLLQKKYYFSIIFQFIFFQFIHVFYFFVFQRSTKAKIMEFDASAQNSILYATKDDSIEVLEMLLAFCKEHEVDMNVRDSDGFSILHSIWSFGKK